MGRLFGLLRILCGVVLFALVIGALVRDWHAVRATLTLITPLELVLAEALILLGLFMSVLTWRRSVYEVGSRVRLDAGARIYLLGQLGKYLPGSVWALAAQTELGKRAAIPRSRGLAASVIAIAVNVLTGLALGVAFVPSLGVGAWQMVVLFGLLAACAIALSPPVLTRIVNLGLGMIRRPQLDREVTWRGLSAASACGVASWLSYGASVWILAVAAGAPALEALPICLAGVPLAMTVGFLVFVTPSGIGIREAVIVAALAPVLDRSEALAIALVARLLFTFADLLAAAAVVVGVRVRPSEAV
jgi:glycosyltransferase 2 family protein